MAENSTRMADKREQIVRDEVPDALLNQLDPEELLNKIFSYSAVDSVRVFNEAETAKLILLRIADRIPAKQVFKFSEGAKGQWGRENFIKEFFAKKKELEAINRYRKVVKDEKDNFY